MGILVKDGMETITIQLDTATKRRLLEQAQQRGVPLDVLITEILRQSSPEEWPESVRQLAGAWGADFPEPEELRRSLETESPREAT